MGRNESAVDVGAIGGAEVDDGPAVDFLEELDGKMLLGDRWILNGKGIASNDSANVTLVSGLAF